MFTRKWWKKAGERVAKTAAQTLVYGLATKFTVMADIKAFDWLFLLYSILVMSVLSLASSILTTPAGPDPEDPSAV